MPGIDAHTHLFAPGQLLGREQIALGDRTFREMYADPEAKMVVARQLLEALDEAELDGAVAEGDREKCLEAGASDYVAKPVNSDQLLSLVRMWLHR
jgi:CheY-like chemotaxis protein